MGPVAAARVVAEARRALDRIAGGDSPLRLSDLEIAALEAIVEVTGRPAMRYLDGRVEMPASDLGANEHWRTLVATERKAINEASGAVGRLLLERPGATPEAVGTAWRLGPDLLVTNRHVVRWFVSDPSGPCATWSLDDAKVCVIDFAATHGQPAPRQFRVCGLVYCATEDAIDLAILRLTPGSSPWPVPRPLEFSPDALGVEIATPSGSEFKGSEVYVVGHPERRVASDSSRRVFGDADGRKRCAPGVIMRLDAHAPRFEHDCSTLGGNSGSCVFTVIGHRVVGVHYGGLDVDESTARGRANVATALPRLGDHPATQILREGRVAGRGGQ
jgi:hypothetical protein